MGNLWSTREKEESKLDFSIRGLSHWKNGAGIQRRGTVEGLEWGLRSEFGDMLVIGGL